MTLDIHLETLAPSTGDQETPALLTIHQHHPQEVGIFLSTDPPQCTFVFLGVRQREAPTDRRRPYIELPQLGMAIEVFVAQAALPNGHAAAEATWFNLPGDSRIHLAQGFWTNADRDAASTALRWLETLPSAGIGRKKLEEEEPTAYWRKKADKVIDLRNKGYTWPDIRKREKDPIRTMQTWETRRRKELQELREDE